MPNEGVIIGLRDYSGVFNIVHCPILEGMEREGEGREQYTCREDHVKAIRLQASCFDPKIKVKPLKLPPEIV